MARYIMERVARAAELNEESFPGLPLVEIAGDQRVLIEHHCGVTQYGRTRISVRVKFGIVVVLGSGLELTRMTNKMLIISGKIGCVQLERCDKR